VWWLSWFDTPALTLGNPTLAHRTRKEWGTRKDHSKVKSGGQGCPPYTGLLSYPRIHRRVQQVGQKIHGDIGQPNRQNASLHQVVIAVGYGLDG
jgi:hypothetical protein